MSLRSRACSTLTVIVSGYRPCLASSSGASVWTCLHPWNLIGCWRAYAQIPRSSSSLSQPCHPPWQDGPWFSSHVFLHQLPAQTSSVLLEAPGGTINSTTKEVWKGGPNHEVCPEDSCHPCREALSQIYIQPFPVGQEALQTHDTFGSVPALMKAIPSLIVRGQGGTLLMNALWSHDCHWIVFGLFISAALWNNTGNKSPS